MRISILSIAIFFSTALLAADDFLIKVPTPEDIEFSVKRIKQTEHILWTQTRLKEMRSAGRFTESTEMMSLLVDKFKSGKAGTDSSEIAKQGNAYRELLRKEDKISQSRSHYRIDEDPRYAMQFAWGKALPTLASQNPATRPFSGMASLVIANSTNLLEAMESHSQQVRAQSARFSAKVYYADRAEKVVSDWKKICDENPVAAHTDNLLFSGDGFTPVGTGLAQLAKRNGLLSEEVRNQFFYKDTDGKLYMDSEVMEATAPLVRSATDDARSIITASRKSFKAKPEAKPEKYSQSEALLRVEREEEEFSAEVGKMTGRVRFLSQVSRLLGKSELADKIDGVGSAAIQIAHSVRKFSFDQTRILAGGTSRYSAFKLTTDLVSVVGQLINLFASSGPSFEEVVLEELRDIKQMIGTVREEMHERFDYVDQSLDRIYTTMLDGFDSLEKQLEKGRLETVSLSQSLRSLETSINTLRGSLYKYLKAGFDRQIDAEIAKCLSTDYFNVERSWSQISDCFVAVHLAATKNARDAVGNAADLSASDPEVIHRLADYAQIEDPWKNIGFLSVYAKKQLQFPGLDFHRPLVNLVDWARYARIYMKMATRWPDIYFQYNAIGTTRDILEAGEELRQAVRNLTSTTSSDGAVWNFAVYDRLLQGYEEQLANTDKAVDAVKKQKMEELIQGYDYAKGASQVPIEGKTALDITEIALCKGAEIPYAHKEYKPKHLTVPAVLSSRNMSEHSEALDKIIPRAFRIAHQIGLGRIEVCYETPVWDEVKEIYTDKRNTHLAALRLSGYFVTEKARIPIFTRKFVSTHAYVSSFQHAPPLPEYHDRNVLGDPLHFHLIPKRKEGAPAQDPWIYLRKLQDEKESMISVAMVWEWENGQMATLNKGGGKEELTEESRAKNLAEMEALVNARFAKVKEVADNAILLDAGRSSAVQRALSGLSGSKNLIRSYFVLGMPHSAETNDTLRSFLYGKEQLSDSGIVLKPVLDGEASFADPATRPTQTARERVKALRAWLQGRLQSDSYTDEPVEVLDAALTGLRAMYELHNAHRPQQPIAESLESLRKEIDQLLAS
ncbi:MAG: hypothetical protein H6617_05170 [Bdellovibrionaceae bacterium]|nr:hypothetical protein [Bdellovibrionales bacterium]MCB9254055.1 hypothetical protein [Pseudobdellovibrionaceae bacterium]